jgi:hypothetical protein
MDAEYFAHRATGTLVYDYGKGTKLFEPWWAMLFTDQGIQNYYCYWAEKWGKPVYKGSAYGCHVTVIRGEAPPIVDKWGLCDGKQIDFWYSPTIRYSGHHAWLDCYCEELIDIRRELGYPDKPHKVLGTGEVIRQGFHLTLGRLK